MEKLLVGLGNIGASYERNRHNIGFMVIEALERFYGFSAPRERFHGVFSDGRIAGFKVATLRPSTYMNRSGISVGELAAFYKIPVERILVFHDDLDLPLGHVRVKQGGGHGGHNGLKSLDSHVGNAYWRVRLGIGHPGMKEKVVGHVLGDFYPEETPVVEKICPLLAEHVSLLLKGDTGMYAKKVMNLLEPK